jgi:hypothetical protein
MTLYRDFNLERGTTMEETKRKQRERAKARRAARAAKLKGAKMRTPQELSATLGVGLNQTYAALGRGDIPGAIRFGARWLIPDRVIERLVNGEPLDAA